MKGKLGGLFYEEEIIYQAGDIGTKMSQSFFLASRLGVNIAKHSFSFGLDIMSGDDNSYDDIVKVYKPSYFFGHAYFGWMDYFLNNKPTGVIDYLIDVDYVINKNMNLKSALHYFTQHNPIPGAGDPFGSEIDVELHARLFPKSNIVLGAAVFAPDAGIQESGKTGYYFYLMPIFNF